jgi:hypothetical protein
MAVYYISSTGDDGASGVSVETPWLTLSKASVQHLNSGDSILLKAWDSFNGPNIFDLDGHGGGIAASHEYDPINSPAADSGPNYIYNNTVYNPISYGLLFTPNGTGVVFRNNLVVVKSNLIDLVENGTGLDTDNNLYFNTTGDPKGWYWNNTKYTTLDAYKTASSQEANSLYCDPLFVSAFDFHLQAGSPCINVGVNVGLTKDFEGNPMVGLPDIGAYERQYIIQNTTMQYATVTSPDTGLKYRIGARAGKFCEDAVYSVIYP